MRKHCASSSAQHFLFLSVRAHQKDEDDRRIWKDITEENALYYTIHICFTFGVHGTGRKIHYQIKVTIIVS